MTDITIRPTFLSVVFAPYSGKSEYTYKTLLTVQEDDYVVVQTPSNAFQVVQVREVLKPEEAQLSKDVSYKWAVQKLELAEYEACCKMEKEVGAKLRTARARKEREVMEFLTEDERKATARLVRL